MKRIRAALPAALVLAGGCTHTINTLPPLAAPGAPIREITLEIPEGFDVRSVDYDATMYSDVSGNSGQFGSTSTHVGGRAFVKVVAVERRTGEQVLLLYENVLERPRPVQIIRFRSTSWPTPETGAAEAPAGGAPRLR